MGGSLFVIGTPFFCDVRRDVTEREMHELCGRDRRKAAQRRMGNEILTVKSLFYRNCHSDTKLKYVIT